MKKNYLNFLCIVVSLIMLCVGCDGNKTSSSDPLEIKKATEFVLQGYQFDGTGVKSLDKIVLYSDNTSHIEMEFGLMDSILLGMVNGVLLQIVITIKRIGLSALNTVLPMGMLILWRIMIFISRNTALSIKESLMAKWWKG